MTRKKRRSLAQNLEAVLDASSTTVDDLASDSQAQRELKQVMVHELTPGAYQPRRDFDETQLKTLADSIQEKGMLQPIIARRAGQSYEIIAGERRWRAAQMAGHQQVPIIVCAVSDESALAFGLIENIQRQDLNPIEEAEALKRLIEEFSLTHKQVAESVGRSREGVSNMIRLLSLTEPVKQMLISKQIDVGHAKALLTLPEDEQLACAEHIVTHKLTVRSAERLARQPDLQYASGKQPAPKRGADRTDAQTALEQRCELLLGGGASIKWLKADKGELRLRFSGHGELDVILKALARRP